MTTAAADPIETKAAGATAAVSAPSAAGATAATSAGTAATVSGGKTAGAAGSAPLLAVDSEPAVITDKAAAGNAETVKVPALSEIKLAAPEGVTVAAEDLAALTTFAQENGLSQAQADKLLARELASRSAAETRNKAEVDSVGETWRKEAEAHPEIGGAKLPAAIAQAKRALGVYATAEERTAIASSPFANNPMFIAIMSRAAAGLPVEDTVHAGAVGAAAETNPAVIMYGKR